MLAASPDEANNAERETCEQKNYNEKITEGFHSTMPHFAPRLRF
jgi:hypothetical protein